MQRRRRRDDFQFEPYDSAMVRALPVKMMIPSSSLLISCVFSILLVAQGPTGSDANFQPMEYVSNENGLLEVTLNVDLLESLNSTRIAPAYNGATVGPTLRVKPGNTVSVTLVNNLPPPTDLDQELYNYILDPQNQLENELGWEKGVDYPVYGISVRKD